MTLGQRLLYVFGRFVCTLFVSVMAWPRYVHRDRIPRHGGVVFAANHTSYMDPVLLGTLSPRRLRFMAKLELFTNPHFGNLITALGAFPVRRATADREALRTSQTILESGGALTIFLEGGTSPDGRLQPPDLGAAMLAARANVPMLPIAIINADKLLPRRAKRPHFAHVTVAVGEPVYPPAEGKADRATLEAMSVEVMRRIAALMREHGAPERVPDGFLEDRPLTPTPTNPNTPHANPEAT
jgi:1-acyl-sn-glycerol-3-phosphate acyltransferase